MCVIVVGVVVLWEHGGWGAGSSRLAAQVIETYVDKERRLEHNLQAPQPPAVEVGAVESAPGEKDARQKDGTLPSAKRVDTPVGPGEKPAPVLAPTAALQSFRGYHFWLPVRPWQPVQMPVRATTTSAALPAEVADYVAGAH